VPPLRIATRGSALARWQAEHVASLLRREVPDLEVTLEIVSTTGDRRSDVAIWELGGKGVFVKEVQASVLDGRADLAVHSAKDLPALSPDGLVIAAFPERGDARDALVGSTLDALPAGGVVASGSARRRAQLAWLRPDLVFRGLRGNVATRIDRASEVDAVVVAQAALERLELSDRAGEVLDPSVMLPQVGQGALAVECRSDVAEPDLATSLARIDHQPTRRAVEAERAFLAELGGDCDLPAGAHAIIDGDGDGDSRGGITLDALLASLDGRVVLRDQRTGTDPSTLGRDLARHLLDGCGGHQLLTP
jgi:hydroxymethylbilane synthase